MDLKTILIVVGLIAALWVGGCFSSANASTSTTQTVIDTQPCYDKAHDIVAPSWAELNKLQRATLAMQAIYTCEGGIR